MTPPSARETFARNLRALRASRQLSQEDLAEMAGIHRTYVSSVERMGRNVSIDTMERLARGLGVPLHRLLDPDFDETVAPSP